MKLLSLSVEMMNSPTNRIGASSIITTTGLKVSDNAEIIELSNSWIMADWGMPDWAMLISMIGGLAFIASIFLNMYLAWNKSKRENKDKG